MDIEETLLALSDLDWLDSLVSKMGYGQMAEIMGAIRTEQIDRAAQQGDIASIIKTNMDDLYDYKGSTGPHIVGDLLLVGGHQIGTPESHTCVYGSIKTDPDDKEGFWQWEHPNASETIRETGTLKNKPYMKSVVALPVLPGMEIHPPASLLLRV